MEMTNVLAMKVLKKSHIIICCSVTYTISEKEVLVLASEHPFITTLYSCFQTKVIFNFFNVLHIYRESLILKFTISLKMYCLGAFAKLQKWIMSFIMSAWLFICLSVCLCGTTLLPLDTFSLNSNVSNLMRMF